MSSKADFDGGIRYGGTVPEDMIAQRLTPDFRWVVVAAPSYLERFGDADSIRTISRTIAGCEFVSETRASIAGSSSGAKKRSPIDVPVSLLIDQGHVAWPTVKQGARR